MGKSIFFHSKDTTPRVCICGVVNEEGNKLSFSASRVSTKTQYVKSIGRKIALGRQEKGRIIKVVAITNDDKLSDKFINEATQLATSIAANSKLVRPNTENLVSPAIVESN